MRFLELKQKLDKCPLIDVKDIFNITSNFDRRRLYEWQQKGLIKKITSNFYIFAGQEIDEFILYFIANEIYFPSYISLETI